ncbi:MAG TPA: hypothetical protein VEI25_00550, partial [Paraburkholderia sp.]|nr:hypothetical protein [Paraburkholderia sp.]
IQEPPPSMPTGNGGTTPGGPGVPGVTVAAVPMPVAPAMPQSREEAYKQLALIADYLGRYEPHSPVPYMILRALEWGSKPLPVLLRELVSSGVDGQRLWTFLGLLPGDNEKSK